MQAGSAAGMADAGVTAEAVERFALRRRRAMDRLDEIGVAAHAVLEDERAIGGGDLDRLLEVLEREGCRMAVAVIRLRHPFGEPGVRQMAFDAGRDVPVAALLPRVELLVHHVAVDAGARIAREVREP